MGGRRRVATSSLGVDYFFVVLRGGYLAQAGQSPGEESFSQRKELREAVKARLKTYEARKVENSKRRGQLCNGRS